MDWLRRHSRAPLRPSVWTESIDSTDQTEKLSPHSWQGSYPCPLFEISFSSLVLVVMSVSVCRPPPPSLAISYSDCLQAKGLCLFWPLASHPEFPYSRQLWRTCVSLVSSTQRSAMTVHRDSNFSFLLRVLNIRSSYSLSKFILWAFCVHSRNKSAYRSSQFRVVSLSRPTLIASTSFNPPPTFQPSPASCYSSNVPQINK